MWADTPKSTQCSTSIITGSTRNPTASTKAGIWRFPAASISRYLSCVSRVARQGAPRSNLECLRAFAKSPTAKHFQHILPTSFHLGNANKLGIASNSQSPLSLLKAALHRPRPLNHGCASACSAGHAYEYTSRHLKDTLPLLTRVLCRCLQCLQPTTNKGAVAVPAVLTTSMGKHAKGHTSGAAGLGLCVQWWGPAFWGFRSRSSRAAGSRSVHASTSLRMLPGSGSAPPHTQTCVFATPPLALLPIATPLPEVTPEVQSFAHPGLEGRGRRLRDRTKHAVSRSNAVWRCPCRPGSSCWCVPWLYVWCPAVLNSPMQVGLIVTIGFMTNYTGKLVVASLYRSRTGSQGKRLAGCVRVPQCCSAAMVHACRCAVAVWLFDCVDVWLCCCVAVWLFGCVDVLPCGCVAVWLCGCVDVSMCRCVDVWLWMWLWMCASVLYSCRADPIVLFHF